MAADPMTKNLELRRILIDNASRDEFLEVVQSQRCAENLLFWESVEEFKQLALEALEENEDDCANVVGAAIAIYCEFIQKGSHHEINLPAHLQLRLERQFALISQRELSGSSTGSTLPDEPPACSESRTSWRMSRWSWAYVGSKPHSRYSVRFCDDILDLPAIACMFDQAQQHAFALMLENNLSQFRRQKRHAEATPDGIDAHLTLRHEPSTPTKPSKKSLLATVLSPSMHVSNILPEDNRCDSVLTSSITKSNVSLVNSRHHSFNMTGCSSAASNQNAPGIWPSFCKDGSGFELHSLRDFREKVRNTRGLETIEETIIEDGIVKKVERLVSCSLGAAPALSGKRRAQIELNILLTDRFLLRFLRAKGFHIDKALKCLKLYARHCTTNGRRVGINDIKDILLSHLLVIDTGAVDLNGLAIVYMRTNSYVPKDLAYQRLINNVVFALERATRNEDAQKRGITFVCNMDGWTWDNFEAQYALAFFQTIQFNFPVHVARFVLVDAPLWFSRVWALIRPMLTKEFAMRWTLLDRGELHIIATRENITDDMGGLLQIDIDRYILNCQQAEG